MLSSNRFRVFLAVSHHLSFSLAARELNITQPAVSQQVRALEEEMGVALFHRRGRSVELTPAGRILRQEAASIVAGMERALERVASFREGLTGSLRIGTIDMASIHYLPDSFRRFRDQFPQIEIFVEIDATRPLTERVLDGRLEMAVVTLPWKDRRLSTVSMFDDVLIPVARAGHPLVDKKLVSPTELSREPMIAYHSGSVTRRLLDDLFRTWGTTPPIVLEIDSPAAILRLVEAGIGVSFVPELSARGELEEGRLRRLNTRPGKLVRRIGIVTRRGAAFSPAATRFLRLLETDHRVSLEHLYQNDS